MRNIIINWATVYLSMIDFSGFDLYVFMSCNMFMSPSSTSLFCWISLDPLNVLLIASFFIMMESAGYIWPSLIIFWKYNLKLNFYHLLYLSSYLYVSLKTEFSTIKQFDNAGEIACIQRFKVSQTKLNPVWSVDSTNVPLVLPLIFWRIKVINTRILLGKFHFEFHCIDTWWFSGVVENSTLDSDKIHLPTIHNCLIPYVKKLALRKWHNN